MTENQDKAVAGAILLIGASRGLGLAMAGEFASRNWTVLGTRRGVDATKLHDLAAEYEGRVSIETLDIVQPDQIAALRQRLSGQRFDMLFVNAGTANQKDEPVAEIATDEFARVMVTNAFGPMRVIEALRDLVRPDGLIGAMSSGQGSITNNTNGRHPIYRASKAALNQLMRSHAALHADDSRALVLMAPGWIRTDLGGPHAPFGIEEAIPAVADVLVAQMGKPGLLYLDRHGNTVPW